MLIATFLKENPIGNYKAALQNGMKIFEKELAKKFDENTLFISEGGAVKEAKLGIEKLAKEIEFWANENQIKKLKVFLPSGTGTTALYLQRYLSFEVMTCACVGDEEYLQKQFEYLENDNFPTILKREKKYHFGKLYK
jgi:1-aminocyclopropane-1-carboxylate deaminase/D-cysteine desulfhydrase-like pyridoxal-dependent ACC family enzyme